MRAHKDILIVIAIIGVVIAGMVIFTASPRNEPSSNQTASLINLFSEKEWEKGNPSASVTLVEYSDFQCPACGAYSTIVKRLIGEFGDRVKLIYRHFPLRNTHKNAQLAAQAAEAAGSQGKFWEMHDLLFENQAQWSVISFAAGTAFEEFAESLNLNIDQFKKDIDSQNIKNKIEKDFQSGIAAGVDHTPTFFINRKQIPNPQSYDEFRNAIIQALGN